MWLLYRPEYYGITQGEDGMPLQGLGEMIIAKHRNGRTDSVQLKFIGKFTKFTDVDQSVTDQYKTSFPSSDSSKTDFTITLPSKGTKEKNDDEDMPF